MTLRPTRPRIPDHSKPVTWRDWAPIVAIIVILAWFILGGY